MKTDVETVYGCLLFPMFIGIVFLSGWVLKVLWGWFMVPATNFHEISLANAIGLTMLVTALKTMPKTEDSPNSAKLARFFVYAGVQLAFLGIGWLAHLAMRG